MGKEANDAEGAQIRKRLKAVPLIFAAVFLLLTLRLVKIMKVDGARYTALSLEQNTRTIKLRNGYDFISDIFDRNGKPLVECGDEYSAVIDTGAVFGRLSSGDYDAVLKGLCGINSGISEEELKKKIEDGYRGSRQAIVLDSDRDMNLRILSCSLPGIYAVDGVGRYGKNSVGSSVTSLFLKNTVPGAGLKGEGSVDMEVFKLVAGQVSETLEAQLDAKGNTVPGVKPLLKRRVEEFEDETKDVSLTLDYDIQKIAEDTLSEMCSGNGAVSIIGAKDGRVLAMASKDASGFERNMITYSKPDFGYNPGSVFKTVVLAAALEDNLVGYDTKYFCSGISSTYGIRCSKISGHGLIGLEDAFANSCNVYFIDLAQKVGAERIIEMAEKFGFGSKVLNFSAESQGMLYRDRSDIKSDTGNIAIGQKDILVTPLQVCGMMETIANDGVSMKPYLVEKLLNGDGSVYKEYHTTGERVISKRTASVLQSLLKSVVAKGTGKKAQIPEGAAGKTGTPQRGEKTPSGLYTHEDGWFAGYFPADDPEYAVTVYAEDIMNQPEGNIAPLIFKAAAEKILAAENR